MPRVPLPTRIRNKAHDVWHNMNVRVKGTKANEEDWRSRETDEFYWQSIDHPHRELLVKAIGGFQPRSILEIGCNSGPNLYRLAKAYPEARIAGIDISPKAIEEGQRRMAEAGMSRVSLNVGVADDLNEFGEGSYDVVFCDAVMIYIGADKTERVRDEMLRVAKKGVVLIEWHERGVGAKGKYLYKKGYWKRDYFELFEGQEKVSKVVGSKVGRKDWDDSCWRTYGHVIEVSKRDDT
jgi:ubiquinone/menaquinone biosynthesis C-methylase UbiE